MNVRSSFYNGIIFYYTFIKLHSLVERIIATVCLHFKTGFVVLIALIATETLLFGYYFLKVKEDKRVKLWVFLIVFLVDFALLLFNFPGRYLWSVDAEYTINEQSLISNALSYANAVMIVIILITAFIKRAKNKVIDV